MCDLSFNKFPRCRSSSAFSSRSSFSFCSTPTHTYIPFVVFHVIPLAIRHFSSCTLLNYLCFLNAIFYVAPFWFVSPCRVFFTCRISCSRLLFATCHTCFFVFFFSVSVTVFSQFDVASFTFNSFKLSRLFSLLSIYLRRWWWVFQTKSNEYSSINLNVTWMIFIIMN